jgi:SseB protein N-terminal domain
MTMAATQPTGALEEAMKSAAGNDEQSIRRILQAFVQSRVFVKLDRKWDGKSFPRSDMRFLLVSDGDNAERPMVAVFTSLEYSNVYGSEAAPFVHVVEVDSAWICLGIPENGGIMINPNSAPNFRIGPEVAAKLREAASKDVEAKARYSNYK